MRMHLAVALLFLPAVAGFGQSMTGTVERIDRDLLELKGPHGPVTLHLGEKTTIRKGKTFHDPSALAVGDEVRVNYYGEQELTAVDVSAKVEFSGVITEAGASRLVVLPASPGKATVFVFLSRDTKLGAIRSHLTSGQKVHIAGWDAGDGVVDAERVAVYDPDLPLHRTRPDR
jgi:hypothetical protein